LDFKHKELILFDLDGTLIDSVPDLALSLNLTLEKLGMQTYEENTIRSWVGNGAATIVKRALSGSVEISEDINEDLFNKALEIFLDFYKDNLTTSTRLYPNVKHTLQSLKQKGYILTIVTNKPYAFIEPILQDLKIGNLFSYCIGADSLDEKKPSAKPLFHVCAKFNKSIEKSIMIGDSKNDILAASNASMDSIAVTYGYNYDENIVKYNPNVVFDNFSSLNKVF